MHFILLVLLCGLAPLDWPLHLVHGVDDFGNRASSGHGDGDQYRGVVVQPAATVSAGTPIVYTTVGIVHFLAVVCVGLAGEQD